MLAPKGKWDMVHHAPASHLTVSPSIVAHQDPRLIACFMFTGAFDWLANGDIFSPGIMLVMMLVACLSVIMFTVIQAGVQWITLRILDLFMDAYSGRVKNGCQHTHESATTYKPEHFNMQPEDHPVKVWSSFIVSCLHCSAAIISFIVFGSGSHQHQWTAGERHSGVSSQGSRKALWVSPSDVCWMIFRMGQASGKALEPEWNCCEVLVDAAADVIFSRNLAGDVYKFKQHWHWGRRL